MKVVISPDTPGSRISPELYSSFAEHLGRCIYGGIWVGEDARVEHVEGYRKETLEALKRLKLPALRWPGGCFADLYHWRDGIGPRKSRPVRHNHWWPMPETNAFGTHEFLRFCELAEAEPYICLNVASGSPQEAYEWLEYVNSSQDTTVTRLRAAHGRDKPWNVRIWAIGNENYGCGGLYEPETYADEVRRYINFLHGAAGPGVRFIVSGGHAEIPDWEDRFLARMGAARNLIQGISPHFYSFLAPPEFREQCSDATAFPEQAHLKHIGTLETLERLLDRTCATAKSYSARGGRMGVYFDEWGIWHGEATPDRGLYQQVTLGDSLWAAAAFHSMHERAEQLDMAAIAQTVNVLQAKILTRGPETILTPTYHVFEMFMPHRGGRVAPMALEQTPHFESDDAGKRPRVSVSSSVNEAGTELFLSIVNLGTETESVRVELATRKDWKPVEARRMNGSARNDHNDFGGNGERIAPTAMGLWETGDSFDLQCPGLSLTTVRLEG